MEKFKTINKKNVKYLFMYVSAAVGIILLRFIKEFI